MDFTISNSVASRFIAVVATLAMVAGVVAPMAANAQAAVVDPAPTCAVIVTSNENGDNPTNGGVETYVHPNWTEDIIGGQWLWSTATVTDTTVNQTETFTHDFIWGGDTITNIDFQFAADNGYVVELNGIEIGSESSATNNHESVTQLIVDPADVIVGENTLSFEITNLGTPDEANPENNPAGFVFKMIIDGTGIDCDEIPPVDVCSNLDGLQDTVPAGRTQVGDSCVPTVIITGNDVPKACIGAANLITNGSFEDPTIATGYSLVATIAGWVNEALSGFEIWNNQNGAAASGNQHLELDIDHPTTISQEFATVPGNLYQVSVAFSPRAGRNLADNKVELVFDGNIIGTFSGDGTVLTQNSWNTAAFNATAGTTTSKFELRDVGTDNGFGTLVDDVRFCLIQDNSTPVEPEYTISGFKFNDENADGEFTNDEEKMADWEIVLTNGEDGVVYDTTDSDGNYSFTVTPGSYRVSETQQKGWEQTATIGEGVNGDVCIITVGDDSGEIGGDGDGGFAGEFGTTEYTCDFGNNEIDEEEPRRSGGGGGTRVGDRNPRTPTGEVLGSSTSTPAGVVLGEATGVMPVGAPNTGAGGTTPVSVSLPTMVAILGTSTRKSK